MFPAAFASLSLKHPRGPSVLLLGIQCGEVVVNALDDQLEDFRVTVSAVVPPRFEVGESSLYLGAGGDVVCLGEQVEGVVVQLPTSIDVVQQLLVEYFRWGESILGVVLNLWFSFFGKFVEFLLDERRQTQMVFLNPLLLVVPERDALAR